MKTLGTTNRDVIRLYLVESLVLCLGGGGVGVVFGVVVGQLFNLVFSLVRGVGGISLFVAPINLLVIMLAVSMLVGLLTGIMPAKRATQISALDALRYE